MDWKKFLNRLVLQMLGSISGDLLEQLKQFAVKFRKDARETANPWDDVVGDLMCGLLGIGEDSDIGGGSTPN